MKLNESVGSGDIASVAVPLGMSSPLGISPLAVSPIGPNLLSVVDNTLAGKLNTPIAFITIDCDGVIYGHIDEPVFSQTTLKWESTSPKVLGVVQFANPADAVQVAASSLIRLTKWNSVDLKETLLQSGLFVDVRLHNEAVAPNAALTEGTHYRSIYFSKDVGEHQVPSIYKYAAIDDTGDVSIFTNKPNYQTNGRWTGKNQAVIAKVTFSENYAFPIYASTLCKKLFGVSCIDDIATPVMVKEWQVDTQALEHVWDVYEGKKQTGFKTNLFNSGIEAIPGVSDVSYTMVESARSQVIRLGNVDYGLPPAYTWAAVDDSGSILLFKSEPRYVQGLWKGRAKFEIGYCQFYPEVNQHDIQDLYWKISNVSAQKFLAYRDHIIKKIFVDKRALNDIWSLSEARLNEGTITLQGDDVDLPDGYKFVAIDANTDINVFKEEPTLSGGSWSGSGKKQIGVAVWDFTELPGKPTTMKDAIPEIQKQLSNFKYEIKDELNFQKELEKTGKFKYFFGKYSEIEKIQS